MRDQGLVLVQFQLEVITQERREPLLDLLGFGFRSGEPEEVIVGVPDIAQPPVARVVRIPAGEAALLLAQLPRCGAVAAFAGALDRLSLTLAYAGLDARCAPRVYSGMRTVSTNLSSRSR